MLLLLEFAPCLQEYPTSIRHHGVCQPLHGGQARMRVHDVLSNQLVGFQTAMLCETTYPGSRTAPLPRSASSTRYGSACGSSIDSIRTEKSYVDWIKRHVLFHGKRHPRDMGATHVERFLSLLAIERELSASTQNAGRCGIAHSCRRHRGPGSRRQWRQG